MKFNIEQKLATFKNLSDFDTELVKKRTLLCSFNA